MKRSATVSMAGVFIVSVVLGIANAWTADDGFITFRVARNIAQGHGPVFNIGERIEASTSPIWTWWMGFYAWVSSSHLEMLAASTGVLLASSSLVLMMRGALQPSGMLGPPDKRIVIPGGILVLLCLRSFWEFETSGLDIALAIFWVGLSWWMVSRLKVGGYPGNRRYWLLTCLVLGLAPVVRAELVIAAIAVMVVMMRRAQTHRWQAIAIFLAPGVIYELYRAVYYAALVPNTAIAKEGGMLRWDLVGLHYLWLSLGLSLAILPAVCLIPLRKGLDRGFSGYRAAFVIGGVLNLLYIAAVGGDYMVGRLVLPGLALIVAPFAVLRVQPRQLGPAVAVLGIATIVPTILQPHLLPNPQSDFGTKKNWIVQERRYLQHETGHSRPFRLVDYRQSYVVGDIQRSYHQLGRLAEPDGRYENLPDPSERTVVTTSLLGVTGYLLPSEVYVIDVNGLADPVSARLKLGSRGRPGHEKRIGDGFAQVRYGVKPPAGPPGSACPLIKRLYTDTRGTLTWSRMWHNLTDSLSNTRMRLRLSDNDAVCAPRVYS